MASQLTSPSATDAAWASVLDSMTPADVARPLPFDAQPVPYGVAIECALDDLRAAARTGRPVAPLLAAALQAGCSTEDIFHALGELRGDGIQAPPL